MARKCFAPCFYHQRATACAPLASSLAQARKFPFGLHECCSVNEVFILYLMISFCCYLVYLRTVFLLSLTVKLVFVGLYGVFLTKRKLIWTSCFLNMKLTVILRLKLPQGRWKKYITTVYLAASMLENVLHFL